NYRTLLPKAARILTGTELGKQEVVEFYGVAAGNVRVVPHPAANKFRNISNLPPEAVRTKYHLPDRFIFYPAQFWPHKNHAHLLIGLRKFNETAERPLNLILSGGDKGNLDYIQRLVSELDLRERVRFLGFVSDADLVA